MVSSLMSKRPPSPRKRSSTSNPALDRAILALQRQRPDEAARFASDVLKSNRSGVLAAHILGRALVMQNRPGEAIEPLQRAARRTDDPAIETLLAKALAAAGREDESFDQLRRTLARPLPFPPAFLELADQLGKAGRLNESIAALESGVALAPGAVELQVALGQLHLKRNDRSKARDLLLQVREVAPERHDALIALAKVMVADGDYAGAADLYRRALGLKPDDAVTRISLGKCLLEMGERNAGEAAMRAATLGGAQLTGLALTALAGTSHGRFFLRPSAAAKFLRAENLRAEKK